MTHNLLTPFADDIWTVEGPQVRTLGVSFPTRMTIVKLADGSLWIDSPVAVSRETLAQIAALGPVRYLVAPTPMHLWRLVAARTVFPDAQLWGAPQRAGFAARSFARTFAGAPRDLALSGTLSDAPPNAWAHDFKQAVLRGNVLLEEVAFCHRKSRTLIVADFIQNYPAKPNDAVGNLVKRAGGVLDGGVPRDIRWSFTDRKLARAALRELLAWDFDKLIVAHGDCVERDAHAFVERAFGWLQ